MGALIKWGRCWWPRGIFIFYSALLLVKSILLTPRHEFISCSALLVVESIFWTPRHEFVLFPLLWVPSFGEVDFVDPEVWIYFLQCSPCGEVDLLDPEARVCLVSLVVVALIWWSRLCWPRGTSLFLTVVFLWWSRSFGPRGTNLFFIVGHPLTSGLWAFWWVCRWYVENFFLFVTKGCHSPVEKFPASKVRWG